MKVSVIIPLYNAELYIGRCLESIINQSYKDVEIILVDDVSTDSSVAVAESYKAKHPSIKIIRHTVNQGSMISRRDGYMAATGEYLMYVDADDALMPDALEKLVCKQVETNADIVLANAVKIYVSGRKEKLVDSLPERPTNVDLLRALLKEEARRSLWGRLYRTTLFRDNQLTNVVGMTIYEDACLLFQVVVNAKVIVVIEDVVYGYFENKASVTQRVYGIKQVESIIMANKIISEVCQPFVQVRENLQHRLVRTVFALYSESVPVKEVKSLLRKHGMYKYGKIMAACRYLKFSDLWYCVKRYIYVRTKLSK